MKRKKYKQYNVKLPEINYKKIGLILAILIFGYFFVSNAVVNYFVVKHKHYELEQKLEKLKEKNLLLKEELYLVKNDSETISYHIRKELGYAQPNEKVYILKKSTSNGR